MVSCDVFSLKPDPLVMIIAVFVQVPLRFFMAWFPETFGRRHLLGYGMNGEWEGYSYDNN